VRFGLFHRVKYLPFERAPSIIEPAPPGLQTEPYDSDPSMYIAVEVPEMLKPLYSSICSLLRSKILMGLLLVGLRIRSFAFGLNNPLALILSKNWAFAVTQLSCFERHVAKVSRESHGTPLALRLLPGSSHVCQNYRHYGTSSPAQEIHCLSDETFGSIFSVASLFSPSSSVTSRETSSRGLHFRE
jgi:hypothetical protein